MRGIYTGAFLARLTDQFARIRGESALDLGLGFDLIAGTSTGACGAGGSACIPCDMGQSCSAGACKGATGASSVLLFGGASPPELGDTWSWDGASWTQQNVSGPPARYFASAGILGSTVVLFGGYTDNDDTLGDTWVWSGAVWSQVNGPAPIALDTSGTMGCY